MKINHRITVDANAEGVAQVEQFVRDRLTEYGVKGKELNRAVLAAEEAAGSLAAHAEEGADLSVRFRSFLGHVTVELTSKGDRYSVSESMGPKDLLSEDLDDSAQEMLRGLLLKSIAEDLRYRHSFGKNVICVTVLRSKRAFLYQTLGAMGLAIVVGLILSALGFQQFNSMANTYVLLPVKTMYMNALKMVVAPVVFFSIVSCIVQFSDISELGRMGSRVISLYLLTTVIATAVGIGVFYLLKPGSPLPSETAMEAAKSITSQTMNVSIKDLIVNFIPSDFLQPFVSSDTLQLIFLAVICGIAAGQIGRFSDKVKELFEAFNDLFLKITSIIVRFMPAAVFCSVCSMILNTGFKTILSVLAMFGTFVLGLAVMMLVYSLILAVVGKISPLPFLKSYPQSMVQVFSMASSSASIPINMEACDKMGIAKKLYSLSIPLGATVNMDGTCVYLAVFSLALAKTYGVAITGASMIALIFTIIVLSIGAPGVAGSGLICLSVLLAQIGIPTEAVGLIMGIDALVGMFRCMSNCTGDVAMSLVVARQENLLDSNRYSHCS